MKKKLYYSFLPRLHVCKFFALLYFTLLFFYYLVARNDGLQRRDERRRLHDRVNSALGGCAVPTFALDEDLELVRGRHHWALAAAHVACST